MRAALERAMAPHLSTCGYCRRPWNRVENHTTWFSESSGCFPLCETCWTRLATPEARLPFYRQLWDEHFEDLGDFPPDGRAKYAEELLSDWPKVEAAVRAGE